MQACEPIRQLGALKEELESAQSPIMRTVFAWLFPFGPGWNSGESQRTTPIASSRRCGRRRQPQLLQTNVHRRAAVLVTETDALAFGSAGNVLHLLVRTAPCAPCSALRPFELTM